MGIGQWDCDIALIFRSYKHKRNTSNSAHWNKLKLESIFLVNTCLTSIGKSVMGYSGNKATLQCWAKRLQ